MVLKWLYKSPVSLIFITSFCCFSPWRWLMVGLKCEYASVFSVCMCLHANVCVCVHFCLHFVGCEWYNTHTQPPYPIVFQGHEWGLYEREFPPVKSIRPANILTSGINRVRFLNRHSLFPILPIGEKIMSQWQIMSKVKTKKNWLCLIWWANNNCFNTCFLKE